MALRLRVISDHRQRLGDKSTFVFGVSGGSIGRSAENDWVLPDDMRYVSGRHARIVFHKGRYLLQDTSSNGTYINDIREAARQQEPARAEVRRHPAHRRIPRAGADRLGHRFQSRRQRALQRRARARPAAGDARRPSDLGASLRLENLLEASNDISSDELKPVNAFGQAVSARTRALHQTQDLPKEAVHGTRTRRGFRSGGASHRAPRQGRRPNSSRPSSRQLPPRPRFPLPRPLVPAPSPSSYENTPGLQAFCRGAGIGAETLPVDAHARMLHLAGQLLRESLLGLKESNRTQQEQRN